MGATEDDPDVEADWGEIGLHEVSLSPYYLCQHPVTQAVFKAVMHGRNTSSFTGEDRPVENVSWFDAAVFCNQLNEILGLEPCYFADKSFHTPYGKTPTGYELPNEGEVYIRPNAQGYRLPTEAEWEYAARAGKPYKYAGSDKLKEVGWFRQNSHLETKPVGLIYSNAFGLYDMSGNVEEWCQNWWAIGRYQGDTRKETVHNPIGPTVATNRIRRGGSWASPSSRCLVAYDSFGDPDYRSGDIGFRLCLVSG